MLPVTMLELLMLNIAANFELNMIAKPELTVSVIFPFVLSKIIENLSENAFIFEANAE